MAPISGSGVTETKSSFFRLAVNDEGVPKPGNTCCCGSLKIQLDIPITNNKEMPQELTKLIGIAKGCDCTCSDND